MRTTRLSELVQQGRLGVHTGAAASTISPEVKAAPRAQPHLPASTLAQARPREHEGIVDKIELLAIQLLSISKSSKHNPDAVLREALLSIEECITTIASKH